MNPRKKITKKRNKSNSNFTPRGAQRSNNSAHHGIFGLDIDPNAIFTVAIDEHDLTEEAKNRIALAFALQLHNHPNMSINKHVTFAPNGSPIKAETPRGTKVKRVSKIGKVSILSNHQGMKATNEFQEPKLNPTKTAEQKKQFALFPNITGDSKEEIATVSKNSLSKSRKEIKNAPARSQIKIAGGSADLYAKAALLFTDDCKRQWAHLIAYAIKGLKAQEMKNFVVATEQANSEMQIVELTLKFIASKIPDEITLRVKSNLLTDSHIATHIDYVLSKADVLASFSFNAQTPNKPHAVYRDIIQTFACSLFNIDLSTKRTFDPEKFAKFTAHANTLFYKKRADTSSTEPVFTFVQDENNQYSVIECQLDDSKSIPTVTAVISEDNGLIHVHIDGEKQVNLELQAHDQKNNTFKL